MLPIEYCILNEYLDDIDVYIDGIQYRERELCYIKNGVMYFHYKKICGLTGKYSMGGQPEYVSARFLNRWNNLIVSWEKENKVVYISNIRNYDGYRIAPEELFLEKYENLKNNAYFFVDCEVRNISGRYVEIQRYKDEECLLLFNPMNIETNERDRVRICFQYRSNQQYVGIIYEVVKIEKYYRLGCMEYSSKDSRQIRNLLERKGDSEPHRIHIENAKKYDDGEVFFQLGRDYQFGDGTKQDYVEALKWYKKSVNKGHITATCNLGVLYVCGLGTEQDYARGIELYQIAAKGGDFVAMGNLGKLYRDGKYVKKNIDVAVEYFKQASDLGYADSAIQIAFLYRDKILKDDSSHKNEIYWLKKSASLGNDVAMMDLAEYYSEGKYVPQSWDLAEKLYIDSSLQDGRARTASWVRLSNHYFDSLYEDIIEAEIWAKKAAQTGNEVAQYVLAVIYDSANELHDDNLAKYWYQKSADQGYEKAVKRLQELNR